MAQENIEKLLDMVKQSPELLAKVKDAGVDDLKKLIPLAEKAGLPVTEEELKEALSSGKLNLEKLAGEGKEGLGDLVGKAAGLIKNLTDNK